MLHVNDNGIISLTRGDTARLNIDISNDASGEAYTLNDEDILHFTLKRKTTDPAALIHKTLSGSTTFHIEPSDTSDLSYGNYIYDVQLSTADGDVYTIIEPTKFVILQEVTW